MSRSILVKVFWFIFFSLMHFFVWLVLGFFPFYLSSHIDLHFCIHSVLWTLRLGGSTAVTAVTPLSVFNPSDKISDKVTVKGAVPSPVCPQEGYQSEPMRFPQPPEGAGRQQPVAPPHSRLSLEHCALTPSRFWGREWWRGRCFWQGFWMGAKRTRGAWEAKWGVVALCAPNWAVREGLEPPGWAALRIGLLVLWALPSRLELGL